MPATVAALESMVWALIPAWLTSLEYLVMFGCGRGFTGYNE